MGGYVQLTSLLDLSTVPGRPQPFSGLVPYQVPSQLEQMQCSALELIPTESSGQARQGETCSISACTGQQRWHLVECSSSPFPVSTLKRLRTSSGVLMSSSQMPKI